MDDLPTRAARLFRDALDIPPPARAAFLDANCADEPALRAAVDVLLARVAPLDDEGGGADDDRGGAAPLASPLAHLQAIRDDAEPTVATHDRTGETIGAFRVIRRIGAGGMGEVWLAERIAGGFAQQVAIKWLDARALSPAALARFDRERDILARLDHPGIARIVDGGTDRGAPWFAMEYVDGRPLDLFLASTPQALRDVLAIFVKLCDAVQYAHRNLVVHRDIKPSNVLVDADGAPRLLDFGVAKALGDADALTQTRAPLTVAYAAPEQVTGAPVTTATDVYALGALLYEMLAGRRPHGRRGDSVVAIMHAVTHTDPAPPSRAFDATAPMRWHATQLRGDLDTIVMKCLDRDPLRRYATAEGLGADIRRYLDGKPVEARPDTAAYRLRKQVQRHPLASALGVLAVVALVTLSVVSLRQAARAEREAAQSARAAAEAQRQATRATAVQDFMLALFERQSPDATGGTTISARELLDGAERDLAATTTLVPETRIALTRTLADLRRSLGDDESAWKLTDAYVALVAHDQGTHSADYGSALLLRAEYRAEEMERSLADCAEGLALVPADAAYGARRAEALRMCARELQRAERFDEAARLLDESDALAAKYGETRKQREFDPLLARAWHAFDRRDFPESVKRYDALLAALDRWPEAPPSMAALARYNLALALQDAGDAPRAIDEMRAAYALNQRLFGEDHPHTINAALKLSSWLASANRFDEARPIADAALAHARATYGVKDDRLAFALSDAAITAYVAGDLPRARDLIVEAIPVMSFAYGDDGTDVLALLNNLSSLQRKLGDFEGARATSRDVLARLGPANAESYVARQAHWRLGWLALLAFDPADAVREAQFMIDARARNPDKPGDAKEEIDAIELLGRGQRATGAIAEATASAAQLDRRATALLSHDDPFRKAYLGLSARLAYAADDWPRALAITSDALSDPAGGTAVWTGAGFVESLLVHRCAIRRLRVASPVADFEQRFRAREAAHPKDETRLWTELAACAAP